MGVQTRIRLESALEHVNLYLLSKIESKYFTESSEDKHWIDSMEEYLNQIDKNVTWELVPRIKDKNVIGTKWVLRNKLNEYGKVIRNKSRLICKVYSQVESIDFKETFTLVARLEAIKIFLAFVCFKNFKVYQMDVNFTFSMEI
jgi:hypothetical protein